MMMFSFHIAFGVLLIAFVAGVVLFYKAKKHDSGFGKLLGILVALFAFLHLICTSYAGISYWKQGFFNEMPMMMHQMMENKGMMMNNQNQSAMPAKK